MQISSITLQSALSQSDGILQDLVSEGNPVSVAAFIIGVSLTLNELSSTSPTDSSSDSRNWTTTSSPISQQQAKGTKINSTLKLRCDWFHKQESSAYSSRIFRKIFRIFSKILVL